MERAAPQSNKALAEVLALRGSFLRSKMRWRHEPTNNIILFGVICGASAPTKLLSEGVGRETPQSTRGVERAAPQSNNALRAVRGRPRKRFLSLLGKNIFYY